MMKKEKKLVNSAIVITIIILCSKLFGFIREILLAYKFGTSYIVDAYTVCITLPSVVFTVFASGFSQSYLPVYARVSNQKEKKYFFSNVTNILLIVSIFICICCFLCSNEIVAIMAPGFDLKTKALTIIFIRIVSFVFPIMTIFNLLSAHLSTSEDFIFSYFCDYIIVNIVIIIFICISSSENSWLLALGYVLASFIALSFLLIYTIKKKKAQYKLYVNFKESSFISLCKMAIPLGVSLLVNQLNTVVDRIFSSTLGEGVTSALNYADKVQAIFLTLTTSIFLTVCYPRINKYFAIDDKENGMYYIKKAIAIAIYTSVPLVVVLVMYSQVIIRILFENGAFSSKSTGVTASCLAFYSVGIPFYAFREIMTKTLAANEKQKLILKNTIITVGSNVLLDFILVRQIGYIGLALATSIAGAVAVVVMGMDLRKYKLIFIDKLILKDSAKIFGTTVISVIIGRLIINILNRSDLTTDIIYIIGILISGIVYVVVSFLVKIDIIYWIVEKLPFRLKIIRK